MLNKLDLFGFKSIRDITLELRPLNVFATLEDINEGENTAPSKRIQAIFPDYHKVSVGPRIAMKIGLAKLRSESPHFQQWLTKLEQLA